MQKYASGEKESKSKDIKMYERRLENLEQQIKEVENKISQTEKDSKTKQNESRSHNQLPDLAKHVEIVVLLDLVSLKIKKGDLESEAAMRGIEKRETISSSKVRWMCMYLSTLKNLLLLHEVM